MKHNPVLALAALVLVPVLVASPVHAATARAPQVAPAPEEPSIATAGTAVPAIEPLSFAVKMTAYNAVPGQTDATPFITASGARTNTELTAARSRDLAAELPFGTVIRIERAVADTPSCRFTEVAPQIGYRIVTDTMHQRWVKKIDVLLDHKATLPVNGRYMNPARVLGVCGEVTVTVVGSVDLKTAPTTQAELAAMFDETAGEELAIATK